MQSPSTVSSFVVGQCWTSEGEPELGIGFVKALDTQSVAIEFPASSTARLYRRKNAPLRRLEFRVGEKIQSREGRSIVIDRIDSAGGLLRYVGADGVQIGENELSPQLTLQRPIERFLSGKWDTLKAFRLRARAIAEHVRQRGSPARGFLGGRVQLLPHQLFVAGEIARRGNPRALLADEVGLGKTIEAAWIMHRLLVTGRIRRVLIVVPEALVNQWFVELLRRFNLSFWVPSSQTAGEAAEELEADDFTEQERVIVSLETFAKLYASSVLAAENWDLVIVDEAHRVEWSEEEPSAEYLALEEFAAHSPGLLLLTATPEQLGIAGHFSRLRLIDPARFTTLEAFEKEHARYAEIVKLSEAILADKKPTAAQTKKISKFLEGKVPDETLASAFAPDADPATRRTLLTALVDHYGTGRVYFRNSRSVVELEGHAFPKRMLHAVPLAKTKGLTPTEALTKWIADFAVEHKSEKTLLICDSARRAAEWERVLKEERALKAVSFHEDLSLLARDRSAAYFEDPKGASILICSEIGGEGRNFQNASNLILTDLPLDPDVLEQRIGRLDRIGQKSDIQIYVPFAEGSPDERRLRWHDEVFGGFTAPPKGAAEVYAKYREMLESDDRKGYAKLLTAARADYVERVEAIESGRDRLIELNSFDPGAGAALIASLTAAERTDELRETFDLILDSLEMNSEDLDSDTVFVSPGHSQFAAYVPGITGEGMSFTYSREKALARTDLSLLTWDHPVFTGTLEAIATQEFGNVAACAWSEPLLAIECSFVPEPATTDPRWFPEEFFAAKPIRIVMDASGKELSNSYPAATLEPLLRPLPPALAPLLKSIPGEKLRGIIGKAYGRAEIAIDGLRKNATERMREHVDAEVRRLSELQRKNGLVRAGEIEWWAERRAELEKAYAGTQLRLDSFLLVIPSK